LSSDPRRNARQGRKRAPPLGGATGNNYKRTGGFGSLPDPDMDYSTWTVDALREFLSVSDNAVKVLLTVCVKQILRTKCMQAVCVRYLWHVLV